jgi:AraC-like DNA-binding protein
LQRKTEGKRLSLQTLINTYDLDRFITSAIIGCVLFLALLCILKKNNTPLGYAFLAAVCIVLALSFTGDLLEKTSVFMQYPKLTILFEPVLFALPPLIYLAVRHLTSTAKISIKVLWHILPYFLLIILYLISFMHQPDGGSSQTDESAGDKLLRLIIFILFFIQMSLYLYHSLRLLRTRREILPFFVSNFSGNDFRWLHNTILGLCILTLNSFFEGLFNQTPLSFCFSVIYLLGFYYVGIQIAQQKDVTIYAAETKKYLADNIVPNETHLDDVLDDAKPNRLEKPNAFERKQVMSKEDLDLYKTRLLNLMETEQPFLDSELTLLKLGSLLQLNTYQTSYLINNCFGENFYVFINKYRLEQCKKMLIDDGYNHLSILGIAFESGFNSKTTFNTAFKKNTGLSPKAFRQEVLKKKF